MSTWFVTVTFDASKTVEVEAETADEAKDKAMEHPEIGSVCLCHQCSREVELGDPIEAVDAWQA